jgi:hypothetical protein
MRKPAFASLTVLCVALAWPLSILADEHGPQGTEPESHVTVALSGGAFLPQGDMKSGYKSGLDVLGQVGWNAENGLGVVMSVEYTPVRRRARSALEVASHMFAAAAAPRYTLGHQTFRMWFSAGGGVVIERTETTLTESLSETTMSTVPTLHGASGIDLHVFETGGLTVSGVYTRSLDRVYDFFSVGAGLVFTI